MTPLKWQQHNGLVHIQLPADLDLAMAGDLYEGLRRALETGDQIEIAADAVERVSTACIQTLLAASRQAGLTGRVLSITDASDVLQEACQSLGLGGWLEEHQPR